MEMRALWSRPTFLVFFSLFLKKMDLEKNRILVLIHMDTSMDQKAPKSTLKFECKLCDYLAYNRNHFNRHCETEKHKKHQNNTNSYLIHTNLSQNNTFLSQKAPKAQKAPEVNKCNSEQSIKKAQDADVKYYCECGKSYKHTSNFYSHRKKCRKQEISINDTNDNDNQTNEDDDDLVIYNSQTQNIDYKQMFYKMLEKSENLNSLFIEQLQNKIDEQNKIISEKDKTIGELIPKIGTGTGTGVGNGLSSISSNNSHSNNTIANTNTNSNNTVNNINLFLNENCKEALSIDEFVKKIEIKLTDLLITKRKGLVNGISNIFIRSLSDLPAKKRPLWCSDKKRKKIFIKEEAWTEDVNNVKTKKAIKDVSFIQAKNVVKYTEKNPDWKEKEDKKDEYMDIVKNTTTSIVDKEGDVINKMVDAIYLDNEGSKKMIE